MASTSASRSGAAAPNRIKTAAETLYSDNQSLIAEIRKALTMMKEIAVDLEKDNQSEQVKELENAVSELLQSYEDCTYHAAAIESVGKMYQPSEGLESTDFKNLLEAEFVRLKCSSRAPQNHPLMRQFRETVWNVNHAGEPMPGEENEEVVMTSTQSCLLNLKCPLIGKPVTELAEPVRSVECKHIYDKKAIMQYIATNKSQPKCPVAACPKILHASKVVCDPLLLVEIEEMRTLNQNGDTNVIEDFTEVD